MGWGGGGRIATDIVRTVEKHITSHQDKVAVYMGIIRALENEDWDQLDEAIDLSEAFDDALEELHPSMFDFENDYLGDDDFEVV